MNGEWDKKKANGAGGLILGQQFFGESGQAIIRFMFALVVWPKATTKCARSGGKRRSETERKSLVNV